MGKVTAGLTMSLDGFLAAERRFGASIGEEYDGPFRCTPWPTDYRP